MMLSSARLNARKQQALKQELAAHWAEKNGGDNNHTVIPNRVS